MAAGPRARARARARACIGMNDITVHQFTIGNIKFEQHLSIF